MDAQLTIVDVTGSTNDDLLEAGKQGAPHGTGLAARAQTAGRGRRGHKWDSTAGNLLLSIVLRPCVNPAKYSGLAFVIACGLDQNAAELASSRDQVVGPFEGYFACKALLFECFEHR